MKSRVTTHKSPKRAAPRRKCRTIPFAKLVFPGRDQESGIRNQESGIRNQWKMLAFRGRSGLSGREMLSSSASVPDFPTVRDLSQKRHLRKIPARRGGKHRTEVFFGPVGIFRVAGIGR